MKIQLLYFDGCPTLPRARQALRDALAAEKIDDPIEEIDVEASTAPEWARGWGSPKILIDGKDVTGTTRATGAACRLYQGGGPSVAEIRRRLAASRRDLVTPDRRAAWAMLGAVSAALAASACCLVPTILAVIGLSGAGFGAALAPYRTYFLLATGVALGVGFWLVYRKRVDDCGCEVPRARRAARVALWITTAIAVALAAYPLLGNGTETAGSEEAPAAATLRLKVTGMDCPECTGTIANRIKKVPGVVSASVDFKSGIAVVRHDGRDGLEAASVAAVKDAGFSATVAP
jgi:copper chaperone CopZ